MSSKPEIKFYHLLSTPLEKALPKLLEKVMAAESRAIIKIADVQEMQRLDATLWTYHEGSFLPHGCAGEPHAERQPIYLTTAHDNPNHAEFLFVTDGYEVRAECGYTKIMDMFDGHDPAAVSAARERWSAYQKSGCALSYIKQKPNGGWEIVKEVAAA